MEHPPEKKISGINRKNILKFPFSIIVRLLLVVTVTLITMLEVHVRVSPAVIYSFLKAKLSINALTY